MKIVVFGATGGTGREIVNQALQAGYQVRAAARTPSKVQMTHANLEVFKADIYDPVSISAAIAGQEAVLSAVAPGGYSLTKRTDLYTQSAKSILHGMQDNHVQRLIIVSTAARRGYSRENHPIFELILKRVFWRTLYANIVDMDVMVMASKTDWTLVRPPQVIDKVQTGIYRNIVGKYAVPGGATIGRADLAAYMVSIVADERLYRQNVAIAY